MLSGVTVLEVGARVSTGYCGRLLCDIGASVVRLEQPYGDPLRAAEPAYAAYLHGGKLLAAPRPGEGFAAAATRLAADADLIVCDDDRADVLADVRAARASQPGVLLVCLSDYGLDGPLSGTPASELTLQSEGGISLLHPTGDRPPVRAGVELAELASGTAAAVSAVTALLYAEAGAPPADGADADVSRFESVITLLQFPWLMAQIPGHPAYWVPQDPIPGIEVAKDGWVCTVAVTLQQWEKFRQMTSVPELDDERFKTMFTRAANAAEVTALVRSYTARHTVNELVETGARNHVPITPVSTPATLPAQAPYAIRGTYTPGPAPVPPFRYDHAEGPQGPTGAGEQRGAARRGRPAGASADPTRPLAGVRVVEFGTFQAGPIVGMNLAALGADVIKVESVARPDMLRFGGNVTIDRSWERASAFTGVNLGKRAITADFGTEEGQQIIRRRIASSDVVLENFVPRVLDSHALSYDQLRAIKPDIIMVRMPAWGLTGPWRDRPGFTYTVNAVCGLSHLTGYPDGEPLITGTIVDPMAAAYSTLIALAAIRRHQHTGQGGLIEVPLCDAAAQLTARAAISAATGTEPSRMGNHSKTVAPQGIYQCADGTWIAVTVNTDYQWKALTGLGDRPVGEHLATLDGRLARQRELDEWLAALCRKWEAPALQARLRRAGIPAAIAATGSDLTEHPQLLARGRVFTLTHPVFGTAKYIGPPARYAAAPRAAMAAPSPLFGQHNHEILSELGYTPAEIERLTETNAIGDTPFGQRTQRH